jgi:hypothetical protein
MNGHLAGIRAARKLRAAKTSAAGASSVKHVSRALAKIANAVISSITHLEARITTFIDQRELRIIRSWHHSISGPELMNLVSQVIDPPTISGDKKDIRPRMALDAVVAKSPWLRIQSPCS